MLRIPTGSATVSFIGIDPGTTKPGIGIIRYDLESEKIVHVSGHCFNLDRLAKRYTYGQYQNHRHVKLQVFRGIFRDLLRRERPIGVASEHPYINQQRPGAVIPLAECLFMTEQEVHDYNPYMALEKIDPSSVKKGVGVKGDSGDKHAMTIAISQIEAIVSCLNVDLLTMDNNAVDGIAVAYCSLMRELDHDFHYE